MNTESINSVLAALTTKEKEALKEAVAPIYFSDSADYIRGLWSVVNVLIGDKIDIYEINPKEWLYALEPGVYE